MLLSEARTQAYNLVDDAGRIRFDSDGAFVEVDAALSAAQLEVWSVVSAVAPQNYATEATITSTSLGVVSLTTQNPIRILGLAYSANGSRFSVLPARFTQSPSNVSAGYTLSLLYVPRVTYPSAAGNAFVWGASAIAPTAVLDRLMVYIAASELLIKDGEVNKALENRKIELRRVLDEEWAASSWSVLPLDGYCGNGIQNAPFSYMQTAPNQLQLVRV